MNFCNESLKLIQLYNVSMLSMTRHMNVRKSMGHFFLEGHEIPPDIGQVDRNECGAVQFSTLNNTLAINVGMFNLSTNGNDNHLLF